MHRLGPSDQGVRPGVGKLLSAFVRRKYDSAARSASPAPGELTFEEGEFLAATGVYEHEWHALRDALFRHRILTAVAGGRYRVDVLAPFIDAQQRVPIFVSLSCGHHHDTYWKNHLLPSIHAACARTGMSHFLDPCYYPEDQRANVEDYIQNYRSALRRRNNLIVLYEDAGQFSESDCSREVDYWWLHWGPTVQAGRGSYIPIQLGSGEMMMPSSLHKRVNHRCPRDHNPSTKVVNAILKALRPDTDPLTPPGGPAVGPNEG